MSNSPSKADQLRALREAKASGGGKVKLQPAPQRLPDHGSQEASKGGESQGTDKSAVVAAVNKRGRPRLGEQRSRPWEEYGWSRRTYYRRKKLGLLPRRKK